MTDGIATGWHHALWLLGWLLGALPALALLAAVVMALGWLGLVLSVEIPHRLSVRRIRRQNRRAGRA